MQNELHAEWVTEWVAEWVAFLHKSRPLCGSMSGRLLALKMAAFLHQKQLLCGLESGYPLAQNVEIKSASIVILIR